jgi:methylthioribulose-1-phosphate dehydratase
MTRARRYHRAVIDEPRRRELAEALCRVGAALGARGLLPATSGNLSAVLSREPLLVAVTRTGTDKGALDGGDVLVVDGDGQVIAGEGRPSDEAPLHLALVRALGAGAVVHTHGLWSTVLSSRADAEVVLEGWEILKALSGVRTHEARVAVPVIDNAQEYDRLARDIVAAAARPGAPPAVLLRGHGLYAWGRDLGEARRHVEALEFLFEVVGRGGRDGHRSHS